MPETRCTHGFLRSAVPCPTCDPPKKLPQEKRRIPLEYQELAGWVFIGRSLSETSEPRCVVACAACSTRRTISARMVNAVQRGYRVLRSYRCRPHSPLSRVREKNRLSENQRSLSNVG